MHYYETLSQFELGPKGHNKISTANDLIFKLYLLVSDEGIYYFFL